MMEKVPIATMDRIMPMVISDSLKVWLSDVFFVIAFSPVVALSDDVVVLSVGLTFVTSSFFFMVALFFPPACFLAFFFACRLTNKKSLYAQT